MRPAAISMTAVRRLWSTATGRPWPDGWRVEWDLKPAVPDRQRLRKRDAAHADFADRVIRLDYWWSRREGEPVADLLHEFAHVLEPDLPHGARFARLVNHLRACCGLPESQAPADRI